MLVRESFSELTDHLQVEKEMLSVAGLEFHH